MPSAPLTRSSHPNTLRGTSRAIYAVTGVVDEVNDLIVPGAFAHTLATRRVKAVWHHEWKDAVGVVLDVEEWMPGDPRFADVPDWPAEAGALVATVEYNRRTSKGRDTYEQVKQWYEHDQAAFSIGYRVPASGATKRNDGVRVIHRLDLFEVSPVLHGAHPMTRALEVKSAADPHTPGLEYKVAASSVELDAPQNPDNAEGIKVAGLAVKAADTSRVLMIQRALDDDDPAAGTWEFPGGHLEDGEDPLAAALREWQEETGSTLPGTTSIVGSWTAPNGIYRGYVAVIPAEASMPINVPHGERRVANPDDPKGEATEVTAWWPITALPDMPLLRPECRDAPWSLLAGATMPQEATAAAKKFADDVVSTLHALGGAEAKGLHPYRRSQHSNAGNCECGMSKESAAHPHPFAKSLTSPECVCSRPAADPIHTAGTSALEVKSARAAVAAARSRTPRVEHKSARAMVAEAKSSPLSPGGPVSSAHQPLPESYEQFRSRLSESVRDLLGREDGTWTCIEATYPDRVIVSVEGEGPGPCSTYAVPYEVTPSGDITLGTPQAVELATIVVPQGARVHRAATAEEDVHARVIQPTVDALTDATARVSTTTADPEKLEAVRATVSGLIAALSAKGLDVTPPGPKGRPGKTSGPAGDGMDLWDDTTFLDEFPDGDEETTPAAAPEGSPAEPPAAPSEEEEETVRLDPEEVKAALAGLAL